MVGFHVEQLIMQIVNGLFCVLKATARLSNDFSMSRDKDERKFWFCMDFLICQISLQCGQYDLCSQNMLELLQKVDQSNENNSVPQFQFSADRMQSEIPHMAAASDGSASHHQYNQSSALQGFGLRLAPPSQRQAVANHALSRQISHDLNVQQLDPESVGYDHKLSNTTASAQAQSPLPADETSQRENSDNDSNLSGQADKVIPHLLVCFKSLSATP